jgi:hypothetical protein
MIWGCYKSGWGLTRPMMCGLEKSLSLYDMHALYCRITVALLSYSTASTKPSASHRTEPLIFTVFLHHIAMIA